MIINLRKYIQGKGFRIFLYIMIATMGGAFSFLEILRRYIVTRKDWAVQVNNSYISHGYLSRKIEQQKLYIRQFYEQYGQYAEQFLQLMGITNPEKLALQSVIQDELLNQAFSFLAKKVTEEYTQRMMYNFSFIQEQASDLLPIQAFNQTASRFDMSALTRFHNQFGFTLQDFYEQLTNAIIRYQGLQLVKLAQYIPLFDQQRIYNQQHARKKFSIMKIDLEDFVTQSSEQEIKPEELRAFYDAQNREYKRYWVPELRSATVWKLQPSSYGISVSDKEIEEYYHNQKARLFVQTPLQMKVRSILIAVPDKEAEKEAQQKADMIHKHVMQNPDQFEQIARQESQDEQTAAQGGLSDYFSKNTYEHNFEKAAFLLKQDGNISGVIRTKRGFEIIQRVDRRMPTYKTLESVRNTVHAALVEKKFHAQFAQDMKQRLSNKTSDIQEFMISKGATKEIIVDRAFDNTPLAKHIFKLQPGQKTFFHDKQLGTFVVELTNITKRSLPALADVVDKVKKDFIIERATKNRLAYIEKIRKQALTAPLSCIAGDRHVSTTDLIQNEAYQSHSDLQHVPGDRLFQIERIGATITFPLENVVYLIRLDEQSFVQKEEKQQLQPEVAHKNKNEQLKALEAGFVASLFRHATIKENESPIHA